MIFKTHVLFACNLILLSEDLNLLQIGDTLEEKLLFMSFVALGSVFPDIDEPQSFIGKKLPVVSHFLSFSFGHRGLTHFCVFPMLIFSVFAWFVPNLDLLVAFCLGVYLHQVGDMLTNSGIQGYFYPMASERNIVLLPKLLRFSTGMLFEKFVFLPLMMLGFLILVYRNLVAGGFGVF